MPLAHHSRKFCSPVQFSESAFSIYNWLQRLTNFTNHSKAIDKSHQSWVMINKDMFYTHEVGHLCNNTRYIFTHRVCALHLKAFYPTSHDKLKIRKRQSVKKQKTWLTTTKAINSKRSFLYQSKLIQCTVVPQVTMAWWYNIFNLQWLSQAIVRIGWHAGFFHWKKSVQNPQQKSKVILLGYAQTEYFGCGMDVDSASNYLPITAVLSRLLFFIEIPRVSIDAVEFSHEDLKTTPRKPCQKLTW